MADRWDYRDDRGYRERYERPITDRAGDEVRSWFGDEEAQRRRMMDERDEPSRGRGDWGGRETRGRGDWGRDPGDRDWGRQWGYVEGRGGQGERSSEWGRGASGTGYGSSPGYGYGSSTGYWTSGYGSSGREQDWGHGRDWEREQPLGSQGYGREFEPTSRGDWRRYSGLGTESGRQGRDRDWMGPHFGRGPRNYQRSDERIREDVCERLSMHGQLDASEVDIQVQNGEVTLQGSVNDRWAKRTAEDLAEGVWGVKEVHNQLRVPAGVFGQERDRDQTRQTGQTGQPRSNWAA